MHDFTSVIGDTTNNFEETYDLTGYTSVYPVPDVLPYPLGNLAGTAYNVVNQSQYELVVVKFDGVKWKVTSWLESRITWIALVGGNKKMYREKELYFSADINSYTEDLVQKWESGETLSIMDVFPGPKKPCEQTKLKFIQVKGTGSFLDKQQEQERSRNTGSKLKQAKNTAKRCSVA